ncbi:oligoendopeptidase F [Treponema parvum]|uniref:Oligopeptidase F n=1 Tax=Treponema parvum TaxID=138851 RepID=A0A975F1U8_9SPIR|nr:oligoendopeptidase F [Treponema parvum]QTQ13046.1 oligoendopeptidase F [Treponema parvum]
MANNSIPERKDVPDSNKWDLITLFKTDEDWEKALSQIVPAAEKLSKFKGKLSLSSGNFLSALKLSEDLWKNAELVGNYAGLQHTADESDSAATDRVGRYSMAYSKASAKLSFFDAEILSIPDEKIRVWTALPEFADYKVYLEKLLYLKPYVLSEKEERIMALQSEAAEAPQKTFSVLSNVDLSFGDIEINGKKEPLTQGTWSRFMDSNDRSVRENAYKKFYGVFEQHQHTLAELYAGSVNQDVFEMRARGYKSSLEKALYKDKVPTSVYHNLIETVHKNLPALHRFYALRKKVLKLDELRHYDVYAPLVKTVDVKISYDEAVDICKNALSVLGGEYTDILCGGLKNGWVDRYENKGKRSGAFSSGAYTGYPYILMNYKDTVIRDVFTLAHEGGHSMHSWYSAHNNPFMQYNYTIFEAEVASTFNEELVFRYLFKNAKDDEMKTYLSAMRACDITATLYRQTMFAEYELKAHELVENGTPLSAEVLRKTYRALLEQYFGPEMCFEPNSDMEGLRIPHFYSAFYVYKYATGISAALALADRVLNGGEKEKDDYFKFLKAGGTYYPIETLKVAGVDMSSAAPVQAALDVFTQLIAQLENMLKI